MIFMLSRETEHYNIYCTVEKNWYWKRVYCLLPISDWCQIYCDQHNVHHTAVVGVVTFLITLVLCTTSSIQPLWCDASHAPECISWFCGMLLLRHTFGFTKLLQVAADMAMWFNKLNPRPHEHIRNLSPLMSQQTMQAPDHRSVWLP